MKLLALILLFNLTLFARIHIMPLGDSITYDDAYRDHPELGGSSPRPASERYAYRSFLWYKLHDAGYDFSFVGSRSAGSAIRPAFDPDNEGYPGETSAYIANHIYGFLQQNPADIILLHIGTNDHSTSVSQVDNILDEIDRYESNYNHHIKVILAKIIQRRSYDSTIHSFNNNIQSLANSRKSDGDDIYLVDMENDAGISSSNYQDRTHPNNTGYNKMANVWYNALKHFMNGSTVEPIPPKPTAFTSAQITSNSVTLSWTDNAQNETLFKINEGDIPIARPSSDSTRYTITGLAANSTHTFNLRACNDRGCSTMQYVTITTAPPPIPATPSSFQVNKLTSSSVTLKWVDNSENETLFKINEGDTPIARPSSDNTSYTITGLAPNSTHTFSLRACNDSGCSEMEYITITTAPPPIPAAPNNFHVQALTPTSVTLAWTDNANNETGFKIWDSSTDERIATLEANITTHTFTNLEPRTTYTFEIRSYNNEGNSQNQTVTFTTPDDYGWLPAVYHVILY